MHILFPPVDFLSFNIFFFLWVLSLRLPPAVTPRDAMVTLVVTPYKLVENWKGLGTMAAFARFLSVQCVPHRGRLRFLDRQVNAW